jgi:hypothetical protein
MPRVPDVLALARAFSANQVSVLDAKAAFCRIRLLNPVCAHSATQSFSISRLPFGTAVGPEALRASLGFLHDVWKERLSVSTGFSSLFVDDFSLHLNDRENVDLPRLVHLLGRCGFGLSKVKFQQDPSITVLLGLKTVRDQGDCTVHCPQVDYSEEAQLTKKQIFALAGTMGYDPAMTHPERRLLADIWRMVAGQKSQQWNEVLRWSAEEKRIIEELKIWTNELLTCSPCHHTTKPSQICHLKLQTDASQYGYSFCVEHRGSPDDKWLPFQSTAGLWKKAHMAYHVNRKESLALLKGLRHVALFVESIFEAALPRTEPFITVEIATDSTTALAWAKGGTVDPRTSTKSVEFRVLCDLAAALHMEVQILRKKCQVVKLYHVAGQENSEADRLSRLGYRLVDGKPIASLLRKQNQTKDETSEVASDTVCRTEESRPPSIELLARDSRDLDQLLYRLRCLYQSIEHATREDDVLTAVAEDDFKLLAHSCQKAFRTTRGNEYVRDESSGLWCFEVQLFTGEKKRQLVIPKDCEYVARLIAKHFHRKSGHRGRRHDMATVACSAFYVESPLRPVIQTIRNCLICSKKNAPVRPSQATAPWVMPRNLQLPAFARCSFDFTHCGDKVIFTAVCNDTMAVFFALVPDATGHSAFKAVQKMCRIYCVSARRIQTDNARALTGPFKTKVQREFSGCEVTTSVPYGSSQNPAERQHRELWAILRARKFGKFLRQENIDSEALEEAASILNQRPLGVTPNNEVITPALLAFGCAPINEEAKTRLSLLREFFYENYFLALRRRHLPNRHVRRFSTAVGQWVLCQERGKTEKDDFKHYVGRVVRISNSTIEVEVHGEKTKRLQSNQIIPVPMLNVSTGGHVVDMAVETAVQEE